MQDIVQPIDTYQIKRRSIWILPSTHPKRSIMHRLAIKRTYKRLDTKGSTDRYKR
jgi:hypothetical protein